MDNGSQFFPEIGPPHVTAMLLGWNLPKAANLFSPDSSEEVD